MAARRQQLRARAGSSDGDTHEKPARLAADPAPAAARPISVETEAAIIATLVRGLRPGENHQVGNANREEELREIFARLDTAQADALLVRLDVNRSEDELARAFGRIVVERRDRLRAFLADARRRDAPRDR